MAASIWEVNDLQLSRGQAKITYLGEQTKPVPTVVFGVEGNKISMIRFLQVQHSRKAYYNDGLPYTKSFSVGREEFRNIMSAVKPLVSALKEQEPKFLSFSLLVGAGASIIGDEFFIPRSQGKRFYKALLDSISSTNNEGRSIITANFQNVYPE